MNIPGIIAIGNGEKCPYCDLTIDEHVDTFKHLIDNHPTDMEESLFGGKDIGV